MRRRNSAVAFQARGRSFESLGARLAEALGYGLNPWHGLCRYRLNGAWRYEFYSVYDLPRNVDDLNPILDGFQNLYNPASQHPSGYVIEGKRLCWSGCDPAGYLGFCRAVRRSIGRLMS
jgi:hypothetical protein